MISPDPANINNLLNQISLLALIKAGIMVIFGLALAYMASALINKYLAPRISTHNLILLQRLAFYLILVLFLLTALQHLGFSLSILLGATGILTVAIGFASQTSISNIVSGIFLIAEKPFRVGETISLSNFTGEVISIDALSVKLKTVDNLLVRIPNETLIKSNIVNLSRFATRRLDLELGIAYKEEIEKVKSILHDIIEQNSLCLKDPIPSITINRFGDSAVIWQLSVWARREDFNNMKNILYENIKEAFEQNNVAMPYPSLSLFVGDKTEPLAIKIID